MDTLISISAQQQQEPEKRECVPRFSLQKSSSCGNRKSLNAANDALLHEITTLGCLATNHSEQLATKNANASSSGADSSHASTPQASSNTYDQQLATQVTPLKTHPVRRNLRHRPTSKPTHCAATDALSTTSNGKENIPSHNLAENELESQLHMMLSNSMCLSGQPNPNVDNHTLCNESSASGVEHDDSLQTLNEPTRSPTKSETGTQQKNAQTTVSISTKSFYSAPKASLSGVGNSPKTTNASTMLGSSRMRRHYGNSGHGQKGINRGVHHKIRRRSHPLSRGMQPVDIDDILCNIRNERLRQLITSKRAERAQIETVHKIFRYGRNPIAMARPLRTFSNDDDLNNNSSENNENVDKVKSGGRNYLRKRSESSDFSDMDMDWDSDDDTMSRTTCQSRSEVEATAPFVSNQQSTNALGGNEVATTKRKFFKSDRTTFSKREVKITDTITVSVCNGKLSLNRMHKKLKARSSAVEFSDEQAAVDAILENFNSTDTTKTCIEENPAPTDTATEVEDDVQTSVQQQQLETFDDSLTNANVQLQEPNNADIVDFRSRLPYNTNQPEVIEEQQILLEFLIKNNICTEENFNIFIADPDKCQDDALRILNEMTMAVDKTDQCPTNDVQNSLSALPATSHTANDSIDTNSTSTDYISSTTTCPLEIRDESSSTESDSCFKNPQVTITEEAPTCSANALKVFPIFHDGGHKPLQLQQSLQPHRQRIWNGGFGANQYQIDAGQRNFGAQQCKQCGLVYSAHEPEEEKLHREFHASLHLLRFRGWIDEDIVAVILEWDANGRIIRLTENAHPKRLERLMEILKIVDKELGFSSYSLPKSFMAYLAVRKSQFAGVCIVEPLQEAKKFTIVNRVDCCTEEKFEAKCGISRIWVSPLHRRMRIASKLIQAVQMNTIFGEAIPLDKIAFSAPTESGKMFAQKVTQMENFLVYQ